MDLAHRVSWILNVGPIPKGMCVLHKCDNPRCVRPDHLFLGTKADNTADAIAKDRLQRGERSVKARLTADQAREIYARFRDEQISASDLGAQYGVHGQTVWHIVRGRTWKRDTEISKDGKLTRGVTSTQRDRMSIKKRKYSNEAILEVIRLLKDGETLTSTSRQTGVSVGVVRDIKLGKLWYANMNGLREHTEPCQQ